MPLADRQVRDANEGFHHRHNRPSQLSDSPRRVGFAVISFAADSPILPVKWLEKPTRASTRPAIFSAVTFHRTRSSLSQKDHVRLLLLPRQKSPALVMCERAGAGGGLHRRGGFCGHTCIHGSFDHSER